MRYPYLLPQLLSALVWAALLFSPKSVWVAVASGSTLPETPSESELRSRRVFSEPLVPVGHSPSRQENEHFANALRQYESRNAADDFSALDAYVSANPGSAWTPALWFNLATEYYNTGWYSKALAAWRQAWQQLKSVDEPAGKALGDRAAGELAYMLARLGRMSELAALLDEVKGRVFVGSATEKIAGAKEGLWTMQHRPETAFKCGPYALDRILAAADPLKADNPLVRSAPSTTNGCSLTQVAELSRTLCLNYQMAYRAQGAPFVVPAVVNWKAGHYAALVRNAGDLYLLQDPTFGNDTWVSQRALESESSGYFLVPPGALPPGWRSVERAEGATVFGKGQTSTKDNTATTPADPCNCDNGSGSSWSLRGLFEWTASLIGPGPEPDPPAYGVLGIRGMAVPAVQLALVGLNLRDSPVGYAPPVGPPVYFVATYNQRDAGQPANFSYSNLGPKWTFNWLAFITDNPSNVLADVTFYTDGGGTLSFTGFNATNQTYASEMKTHALLRRTSSTSYEMVLADGSKTIFAQPDNSISTSRRVFMTQEVDPAGNAVSISYDGTFRVTAVTDAIGQSTTFAYTNALSPLKITSVTDPFGRSAVFLYDGNNRLASITDTLGLSSQFTYDSGDFIQALTTPYGTTSFQKGGTEPQRWLVTTYPNGEQEKVEFLESSVIGIPSSEPVALVPTGMATANEYLIYRNTFYWDRNAYAQAPGDYTQARLYHWLHYGSGICSSVLESVKAPLEDRIWFAYDGQPSPLFLGTSAQPSAVGRVLDDGTTQLSTFRYNALGKITNSVDPVGRSTTYVYATNLLDLLEVRQTNGAAGDLVARFLYNPQHLAVAVWDAAGQMTTNSYNARGELVATTDPQGNTVSFSYDPNGCLLRIDGPLPGNSDSVSFTYDAAGRVRTYTDLDGYTITNSYDALDRLTNITYPDGTFLAMSYDRLDRVQVRDRAGQTTHYTYDALRRLTAVQDPLNRVTRFGYCACDGLASVVDALGRGTHWAHDVQGRIISKAYADGSQEVYGYETNSSRLKSILDAKGQSKFFAYTADGDVSRISYPVAQVPTPTVTYTYDPSYHRLAAMQDGLGTTLFSYYPAGVLGALQVASVDGPWSNDTVTYQYDELGRLTSRAINGVAEAYAYDGLSRPTNIVNALGSFAYAYDGPTARVLDLLNPNGQASHLSYLDNLGDRRLRSVAHLKPDASVISLFSYAYNAVGQITNWMQVLAGQTNTWALGYDPAGQLTSARMSQGASVTNYTYTYDAAGNRVLEALSTTNQCQYNGLNQLVTSSDTTLTNAVYEWDAEGRLSALTLGTARSEFTYDGYGRRCRIVEKTNGVVQTERRYVWCLAELCEERDATDTVTRRFFGQGFTSGGASYFYTRDHLGSVREVLDTNAQVQSRYTYDPYGRRGVLLENRAAPFGFTGYYQHAPSGLALAPRRVYDSNLGRWLSRDPLGERGGVNLYAYAGNDPVNHIDPMGLCWKSFLSGLWNQSTSALGDLWGHARSWYNMNLYIYQVRAEEWLAEHKQELAEQVIDNGERAAALIAREPPSGVPLVPVIMAVSKDPPAFAAGVTQMVTEGTQISQAVQMVNDADNGRLNPNQPVLPVTQQVQTIGNAVSH